MASIMRMTADIPLLRRQGDVLIEDAQQIPAHATRMKTHVLYQGEASGHAHALKDQETADVHVQFIRRRRTIFLQVHAAGAEIVHPEHRSIVLGPGIYKFWQQREYVDSKHAPRQMVD